MASVFSTTTHQIGDYFAFTGNKVVETGEKSTSASPISWTSSHPTYTNINQDLDDTFSSTSLNTSPTTPSSDPDLPSATTLTHKRKQVDKVDDQFNEEDFGTFEDWLKWDETDPSVDMNNISFAPNNTIHQPEESVVFIEDPVSNSPLFQSRKSNANIDTKVAAASTSLDNLNLVGIPPQSTVFGSSLPLVGTTSWPVSQQQFPIQPNYFTSILSPQEENRLRNIAMPNFTQTPIFSPNSSLHASQSPSEHGHISKRPNNAQSSGQRPQRKRKSTTDTMKSESFDADEDFSFNVEDPSPSSSTGNNPTAHAVAPKGKKTSHNMIEKRYRNNLNDKIAELRDSVPSLRVVGKHGSAGGDDEDGEEEEDLDGLTPAHRLNKATILSKATEYIGHLEKRNDHLTKENAGLKARVDAFEMLMMNRQQQQQQQFQAQQYQQQQQQQQQQEFGGQRNSGWIN